MTRGWDDETVSISGFGASFGAEFGEFGEAPRFGSEVFVEIKFLHEPCHFAASCQKPFPMDPSTFLGSVLGMI